MDGILRVSGKVAKENQYVRLGLFHTIEVEISQELKLFKDNWDQMSMMELEKMGQKSKKFSAIAILMQMGLANICVLSGTATHFKFRVSTPMSRKKDDNKGSSRGLENFFRLVQDNLFGIIDFDNVDCIIVASPGFLNQQFFDFVMQKAVSCGNKDVLKIKEKFILVHSSSGQKSAINELLEDKKVLSLISETKAGASIVALNEFYQVMRKEYNRVTYGIDQVLVASEQGAVQQLLIADTYMRAKSLEVRKKIGSIVENVKKFGGKIVFFYSFHVTGERLSKLTGIAAILYMSIPELEEMPVNDTILNENSNDEPSSSTRSNDTF